MADVHRACLWRLLQGTDTLQPTVATAPVKRALWVRTGDLEGKAAPLPSPALHHGSVAEVPAHRFPFRQSYGLIGSWSAHRPQPRFLAAPSFGTYWMPVHTYADSEAKCAIR